MNDFHYERQVSGKRESVVVVVVVVVAVMGQNGSVPNLATPNQQMNVFTGFNGYFFAVVGCRCRTVRTGSGGPPCLKKTRLFSRASALHVAGFGTDTTLLPVRRVKPTTQHRLLQLPNEKAVLYRG